MKEKTYFLIIVLITTLIASAGCGHASGESNRSQSQAPATQQASTSPQEASAVAQIVFIDQEQACECTQNRINGSWAALQAALGEDSGVTVERIHRDTQEEQAEEYRMLQPMVTVPGIYLLNQNGAIVELLQGEVTEAQVRTALGGGR